MRPGEESIPLQGIELLGVITSHGPTRESYSLSQKARGTAATAAIGLPAADAALSAERVRAALFSRTAQPALLQPALPGGGAEVVALESPGKIPEDGAGPAETERSKPTLPGTNQDPETSVARSPEGPREGHHYRTFFSTIHATGRDATRASSGNGEVPCNVSVPTPAGARWNGFRKGSDAGNNRAFSPDILIPQRDWPYIQLVQ